MDGWVVNMTDPDDHHARGAGTSPLLFQQPVDLRLKFEARGAPCGGCEAVAAVIAVTMKNGP
jgi:hypothetical protein